MQSVAPVVPSWYPRKPSKFQVMGSSPGEFSLSPTLVKRFLLISLVNDAWCIDFFTVDEGGSAEPTRENKYRHVPQAASL